MTKSNSLRAQSMEKSVKKRVGSALGLWLLRSSRGWIAGGVIAVSTQLACGALSNSNEPGIGSETHFLSSCVDSCSGGLECICGVCTEPCEGSGSCARLASGASCEATPLGCGAQAPAASCQLSCERSQDCEGLGGDLECNSGLCVERSALASQELAQAVPAQVIPGVGEPCIPGDERDSEFSGSSRDEVNVESSSPQCLSRICLTNHFQGRVTCAYGQEAGEGACQTPTGEEVTVEVRPQLLERRPSDSVHCSCRCDGPEEDAAYCSCPSGMTCEPLIEDLGLGAPGLAGSYCVYSRALAPQLTECSRDNASCE